MTVLVLRLSCLCLPHSFSLTCCYVRWFLPCRVIFQNLKHFSHWSAHEMSLEGNKVLEITVLQRLWSNVKERDLQTCIHLLAVKTPLIYFTSNAFAKWKSASSSTPSNIQSPVFVRMVNVSLPQKCSWPSSMFHLLHLQFLTVSSVVWTVGSSHWMFRARWGETTASRCWKSALGTENEPKCSSWKMLKS